LNHISTQATRGVTIFIIVKLDMECVSESTRRIYTSKAFRKR
jgi:hypothetical protein